MPRERTLAIVKPDGVFMGQQDHIQQRYEAAGLTVITSGQLLFSQGQATDFYAEHRGQFFFAGLVLAMSSDHCFFMELEGEDAIATVRRLNGHTDPRKAEPGTIRHDFRSAGGPFNTVHGSDSETAYQREREIVRMAAC